jgi:3-methyladenine DNA glycosylase AlkC
MQQMSNLLKDLYSVEFYDKLSEAIGAVLPSFEQMEFKRLIFDDSWNIKELKQRTRHTALMLSKFFPAEFHKAAELIEKLVDKLLQGNHRGYGIEYMILSDYIEVFGIDDFHSSVKVIECVTPFTSCEFAVRPFIIKYGSRMIKQMHQWSLHTNHHVRRLASEGARPRLPWAMALPELKKNPTPILPILHNLKNDPSEYVRRSVANNLNDISKDNPDVVLSIARKWKGLSKETDALIKHGCRTLLKQGHAEVLKYYSLNGSHNVRISGFKLLTHEVELGDSLKFTFTLHNTGTITERIRLEYCIYYVRRNGQSSRKVFKLSERLIFPGQRCEVERKQSFKLITTRKFYAGQHRLAIIINGQEGRSIKFNLKQ